MEDENVEINMEEALKDMSSTFASGEAPPAEQAPAGQAPAPETPPQPNPWDAYPKSWRRAFEQDWASFRPELRQYVHEREKQMLDGLMQYKTQLEPYTKLAEQYKPYLEQFGMSLPEVVEKMLNAHLALLYAEPQVKQQYLQELIKDYDLDPLLRQTYGGGGQPDIMSQVQQLIHQAVSPLQQQIRAREEAERARRLEETIAEVDKFVSDPQNTYASELVEDMIRVINGGLASTLKEAYDLACRINPAVSKKIFDAEVAKLTKPAAPAPRNVRSGSTPPASTSTGPTGDIEDTMRQVYQEIVSR